MANPFYTNVFRTQENVNKDNMNYTVIDKDQKLSAFFPMPIANANGIKQGVICNGIGTIDNQFGFNSITNQFLLTAGILRFPDAISNNTPYNITNQTASIPQFLSQDSAIVQLTITTGSYYLTSSLQVNGIGSGYQYTNTNLNPNIPYPIILTSAFTGINQIALCLITIVGTTVTISTDINCAVNYGTIQYSSILYQQGRLTGISSSPYGDTPSDGSGTPNLYFTPTEQGNLISLYNYTSKTWETQTFNELSLVVPSLNETSLQATGELTSLDYIRVGTSPTGIAISPNGNYVYVCNFDNDSVSQFTRGSGGTLSANSFVNTGSAPTDVAVSPDGSYVFITNYNSNTVSQYSINSDGTLSANGTAQTGRQPWGIAISPTGNHAYVTNKADNTVSEYSISGGLLTPLASPNAFTATGSNPVEIVVSPDGLNVYITNNANITPEQGGDSVSQYSRNPSTGVLTPLNPSYIAAGVYPEGIAISPDGLNVYVCNNYPAQVAYAKIIQIFSRSGSGTSGQLASQGTIGAGSYPRNITVSPDGLNVYVTNNGIDNTVTVYSRSGNTLTSIETGVGTGVAPTKIVISPDGINAYLINYGGNSISEYTRTPAPIPTVRLTSPSRTTNVSLTTPITIRFSEAVTGVNTNTIQFQTQGGAFQTITISPSGNNTYTLTGQTLANGITYLVLVNSGITSVVSGIAVAPKQFPFTTIPTGPTVQLTSPTTTDNVSLTPLIQLTFSVAVTNVTTTTINFKAIGGSIIPITITQNGNIYTINLSQSLLLSTKYVVQVLSGITGTGSGTPAVVPINFYFTTTIPQTLTYDIFVGKNTSNILTLAKDIFSNGTVTNRQQLANGKWVNATTIITPSGNNIPVNQGLFVGSIAVTGGIVQSWTGNRSIWNLYNQVSKALIANAGSIDPTLSSNPSYLWSYPNSTTSNNFRNQNNNNYNGTGRLSFILDLLYNKGLVLLYNGSGVSGLGTNTGITGVTANTDLGDGTTPPTSAIQLLAFAIYGNDPASITSTTNNWHTLSYLYNYNSSILQPVSNIAVGFNFIQKIEKTFTSGYFSDTGGGLSTEFWG